MLLIYEEVVFKTFKDCVNNSSGLTLTAMVSE